jgi:hypothetical protein
MGVVAQGVSHRGRAVGFTARAVGESIFTEADDLAQLHERAREAVRCHFDGATAPKLIRLHYVRDEVIAA